MTMRVAFLGLGVMGYPMAGHLKRAGHDVVVYNRTKERAGQWVAEYGGESAATPADTVSGADFVMACVGRDADLRSVTLGENGAFAAMKKASVFVDHTPGIGYDRTRTSRGCEGRRLRLCRCAGLRRGVAGAKNGQLTLSLWRRQRGRLCGAAGARDVGPMPNGCRRLGVAGAGQLTKMVNLSCIAGLVQALSEGLSFARARPRSGSGESMM